MAPPAEQQPRTFAKPLWTLLVKRLHALRIDPHPFGAMKLESMDQLYRIHEGGDRTPYAIREQNLLVLSIKREIRIDRRLDF